MANIYDFSHQLFGDVAPAASNYFLYLDKDLKRADMTVPLEKYVSFIFTIGFLAFLFTFVFLFVFGTLLKGFSLMSFLLYLAFGLIAGFGSGFFASQYPKLVSGERGRRINNTIAFAGVYLSTLTVSGFPPHSMFKLLSGFKEYKEIASESKKIAKDIEVLGLDFPSALTRAMARSPSSSWTELLAGMKVSTTTGGDLNAFILEKTEGYIGDYKRRLEDYSEVLTTLIQVYVTLVIVGAVFFIVISSLVITIGGVSATLVQFIQYFTVVVGIPMLTAAFILVVRSISPWEK